MILRSLLSRLLVGSAFLSEIAGVQDKNVHLNSEGPLGPEDSELPLVPEAAYLASVPYRSPEGFSAICTELDYFSYLNVLVTRRRKRIILDSFNVWREYPQNSVSDFFYWKPLYTQRPIRLSGLNMLLRSAANNYYHTLIDNLPRLYALHHPRYRGISINILVPYGLTPTESHFLPLLLPDNARVVQVEADQFYRPEAVLFSSYLSRQMCGYLPKAYLDFFLERTSPLRPSKKIHRIYITRRGIRRLLNEDEVVKMLAKYHFETYALENLSLPEQIELFHDAAIVVAPHGAGLTNLLFAKAAKVIELHPQKTLFPYYYFLSLALSHSYRYWCGNAAMRNDDYFVDVFQLERMVCDALTSESYQGSV